MIESIIDTLRRWQGKRESNVMSAYMLTMGYGMAGSLNVFVYKVDTGFRVEVHKPVRIDRTLDGDYMTESEIVWTDPKVFEVSRDAVETGCRAAFTIASAELVRQIRETL
jgi:hypothetical protein